jgi:hypothetical protein
MSEVVEQVAVPEPGVLAAAHCIVRSLLPGNGRSNICDSEEELRHRLRQDGAEVNDDDLSEALLLLEENGSPTGYDVGMIPGLPYKVVRPESRLQRSRLNPNPPRGIVLEGLRPY